MSSYFPFNNDLSSNRPTISISGLTSTPNKTITNSGYIYEIYNTSSGYIKSTTYQPMNNNLLLDNWLTNATYNRMNSTYYKGVQDVSGSIIIRNGSLYTSSINNLIIPFNYLQTITSDVQTQINLIKGISGTISDFSCLTLNAQNVITNNLYSISGQIQNLYSNYINSKNITSSGM